ncbi:MAG: hypothetical protein ISS49_14385 [Anaerolineae bacterium]|nr:hypothetical protein [Anaerolineae bacterium]
MHADYGPVEATIELDTPVPFRARYLAFYYPGWRVTVDGDPVPIAPTEPDGLISFDVPAGRHTIRIRFGETPLRLIADAISLLSLAALVALLIIPTRHSPSSTRHSPFSTRHSPFSILHSSFSILLALALLIAKVTIIDRVDTPLRRANLVDGRLRDVDVPAEITFGDEFVLLGHDALPESVASGERFEIKTYWRALQPGGPDYGITVNVVDAEGYRWNGADIRPPRWHRTPPPVWEWPPDQYAIVALSVPLLPGTPPGDYTVEVVAFDQDTLAPLTAHDANGRVLGPALPLGQITVAAPRHPADPDVLGIRHRLDASLGPLTLLGADFDRDEAAPGDPVLLTTFWRANGAEEQRSREAEGQDLTAHLVLLAPDGSTAAEYDFPPTAPWHPTSTWHPGDVWRGQHLLHLPAHLDTAAYTWTIQLAQSPSRPITQLSITAPDRTFTPSPVDTEIGTRLGNVATLVGVTQSPSHPITITLVWRAEAETHTSYHVFLHLIGPDPSTGSGQRGALVAQSDGVPANWTRPTTGWLPGEYITDAHTLTIPPDAPAGDYTLYAGLYVPGGERVTAPDGSDTILLTTITVQAQ